MTERIRVLVAKPGLDGHDRGALVIAQGLRDAGMEVVYTGLRQTPLQIVNTAIQEDVQCIGLSSLSGAHLELFPEVVRILKERGADDILVVGGGVIPEEDIPLLKQAGVADVFTPGTTIESVAEFIRTHVRVADIGGAEMAPKVTRVDHVAIAVESIASALPFYTQQLGLNLTHEEVIEDQGVRAAFLTVGDTNIELLEPMSQDSPVAKFIEKRGSGIHHIAYAVDDLVKTLQELKESGYRLIDEVPRKGGHGKLIAFVHPKETNGVLTEFCERGDV